MSEAGPGRHRIATSRRIMTGVLAVAAMLAAMSAILFQTPDTIHRKKVLTDFDAFHIAGTMAGAGQAADTYDTPKMLAAQEAATGTKSFMPWTYPPPFTLVVDGLARLPIGLSYFLFIATSFLFYLHVLRRIAGPYLPGVLIAVLPAIILIVRTGQNGFLTAGLIGAFLLSFRRGEVRGGLPLGLMVIKPHLAGGIALLGLLGTRWTALALAAAVVIAALLLSTLAYGWDIWAAFIGGIAQAGGFLAQGHYLLYRMSSVYAFLKSFGAPAPLALGLHALVAATAAGLLIHAWRRQWDWPTTAALACAASLFVSPYNYDYDLAILGVAAAFALPGLLERASRAEMFGLALLSWAVTGYGLAVQSAMERRGPLTVSETGSSLPSLIGPALIALVWLTLRLLRRAPATARTATSGQNA